MTKLKKSNVVIQVTELIVKFLFTLLFGLGRFFLCLLVGLGTFCAAKIKLHLLVRLPLLLPLEFVQTKCLINLK